MREIIRTAFITPAKNGFIVYANEEFRESVHRIPYVFETLDNALSFIKENLKTEDERNNQ